MSIILSGWSAPTETVKQKIRYPEFWRALNPYTLNPPYRESEKSWNMDLGWSVLGSSILYLNGMRILLFQLSGFYYKGTLLPSLCALNLVYVPWEDAEMVPWQQSLLEPFSGTLFMDPCRETCYLTYYHILSKIVTYITTTPNPST